MIPKIIHQALPDKKNIHPVFLENIERIKQLNPGWEHRLYDNSEFRDIIGEPEIVRAYDKINPEYGASLADMLRYVVVHRVGGVYLDIKATLTKPLDSVLSPDDSYYLWYWDAKKHPGWGRHPELKKDGEYLQWCLVAEPQHPFLVAVIEKCIQNIHGYDKAKFGVGRIGELRTTGPIAYTLAIYGVQDKHPHKFVNAYDTGFQYSIFTRNREHEGYFKTHYSKLSTPVVLAD